MNEALKHFETYLTTLGYGKATINRMLKAVRELSQITHQKALYAPDQISQQDIESHHEYLQTRPHRFGSGGLSEPTIYGYLYGLRIYFSFLQEQGKIKSHPMSNLFFKSPIHEPRAILSQEEIKLLYQSTENYKERTMLGLYYGCGLRKSEGEKLNRKDVDLRQGLLYVRSGKHQKRRAVPMSKSIREDIKNYCHYERKSSKEQEALVFNAEGNRMRGHSYRLLLFQLIQRTNDQALMSKPISLHCLRHSIGTHLLEQGLSLEQVRDFLGHQHLETTQLYTRVAPQQLHIHAHEKPRNLPFTALQSPYGKMLP